MRAAAWPVCLLVPAIALAGCAADDATPTLTFVSEPDAPPDNIITLYGEPRTKNQERDVSIRFFFDGSLRDIVDYTALRDDDPERDPFEKLKKYRLSEGRVDVDVVADGSVGGRATLYLDEYECEDLEIIVRVWDAVPRYVVTAVDTVHNCAPE